MSDIQNVSFSYGAKSADVFNDFSLHFGQGSIYGLLGENGTGKSTLLYIMMGLLRPESGSVMVEGFSAWSRRQESLQDMYLVPEEFSLPRMSLADYIQAYRPFYPKFSDDLLMRCLQDFHLHDNNVDISQFSLGDKKKVMMSFALATNARYLLMDEPTNGLDLPSKKQFRKVIAANMSEERSLIIATHQLHDVEQLLDHVLIIKRNELLLNQSVTDLCTQYTFDVRPDEYMADDVLYHERTIQGNSTLSRRQTDDEETPLNLELLFNAVIANKLS